MGSMGSHQSASALREEWITPPHIARALGEFDLDPCASVASVGMFRMARKNYILPDDGLSKPWDGCVWLNPPYGKQTDKWLARLADHGSGIALIFARTETQMFFDYVWPRAWGLLFLQGRLHFYHPDGRRARSNAGAPSVLVSYGEGATQRLRLCGLAGQFVRLRPSGDPYGFGRRDPPCGDCVDGWCTMNCSTAMVERP